MSYNLDFTGKEVNDLLAILKETNGSVDFNKSGIDYVGGVLNRPFYSTISPQKGNVILDNTKASKGILNLYTKPFNLEYSKDRNYNSRVIVYSKAHTGGIWEMADPTDTFNPETCYMMQRYFLDEQIQRLYNRCSNSPDYPSNLKLEYDTDANLKFVPYLEITLDNADRIAENWGVPTKQSTETDEQYLARINQLYIDASTDAKNPDKVVTVFERLSAQPLDWKSDRSVHRKQYWKLKRQTLIPFEYNKFYYYNEEHQKYELIEETSSEYWYLSAYEIAYTQTFTEKFKPIEDIGIVTYTPDTYEISLEALNLLIIPNTKIEINNNDYEANDFIKETNTYFGFSFNGNMTGYELFTLTYTIELIDVNYFKDDIVKLDYKYTDTFSKLIIAPADALNFEVQEVGNKLRLYMFINFYDNTTHNLIFDEIQGVQMYDSVLLAPGETLIPYLYAEDGIVLPGSSYCLAITAAFNSNGQLSMYESDYIDSMGSVVKMWEAIYDSEENLLKAKAELENAIMSTTGKTTVILQYTRHPSDISALFGG